MFKEDIGKPEFDIAPELSCVKIMRSTVEGKDGKPLTGCFPDGSGLNSGAMACPSSARIWDTQAMAINTRTQNITLEKTQRAGHIWRLI